MDSRLTDYELRAQDEVQQWRGRPPSRTAKALAVLNTPLQKPMEFVMNETPAGKAIEGVLRIAMDAASWSVNEARVLENYREAGYAVSSIEDIRSVVPLEAMDRQAAKLAKAYRAGAGGEGALIGIGAFFGPAAGAAALMADLAALTSIACRAAAHHAAVYGYRVDTPAEQALALSILGGASSADLARKEVALHELQNVAVIASQKKAWEELQKNAMVKALEELAERLGLNLTKAKLGGIVAGVGIFIGGGYNAWFLHNVCDWGFNVYRERHIIDKLAATGAGGTARDMDLLEADVIEQPDEADLAN